MLWQVALPPRPRRHKGSLTGQGLTAPSRVAMERAEMGAILRCLHKSRPLRMSWRGRRGAQLHQLHGVRIQRDVEAWTALLPLSRQRLSASAVRCWAHATNHHPSLTQSPCIRCALTTSRLAASSDCRRTRSRPVTNLSSPCAVSPLFSLRLCLIALPLTA